MPRSKPMPKVWHSMLQQRLLSARQSSSLPTLQSPQDVFQRSPLPSAPYRAHSKEDLERCQKLTQLLGVDRREMSRIRRYRIWQLCKLRLAFQVICTQAGAAQMDGLQIENKEALIMPHKHRPMAWSPLPSGQIGMDPHAHWLARS